MKDQKTEDHISQKDQNTGQQIENRNKTSQEVKPGLHDKSNTQRLRTGEDQNFRSANNDTLGIP